MSNFSLCAKGKSGIAVFLFGDRIRFVLLVRTPTEYTILFINTVLVSEAQANYRKHVKSFSQHCVNILVNYQLIGNFASYDSFVVIYKSLNYFITKLQT